MRRAGSGVAHHDEVGPHGAQRIQSVHQALAFRDAGARSRDGKDIGAEALGRDFKAGAGARGGFEKQVDDSAPAQEVEAPEGLVGRRLEIAAAGKDSIYVGAAEVLDAEQAGALRDFCRRRRGFASSSTRSTSRTRS